jgi:lysophospholipase L1-like esterase
MKLAKHTKLVMTGDSITDVGRARPVGEGRDNALGFGYVAQVDALLGAAYPELQVRIVNQGQSGDTARTLAARWQADVLDLKPDWISLCIGVNDVWRQFDSPRRTEDHVYPDEYEKTVDKLLSAAAPLVKGFVLFSPFYLEPNKIDGMRSMMDKYGRIIEKLAVKHGVIYVDLQAEFDRLLAHYYPAEISWDRVHPNQIGHMVIARAFLSAIGYSWRA